MKSRVDVPEAVRLREQGWTLQQVGEKYGVTRERIRQLTRDADLGSFDCALCGKTVPKRTAADRYCSKECCTRGSYEAKCKPCPSCGVTMGPVSALCHECTVDQHEEAREACWREIQRLWREGVPVKEIAPRVGLKNANVVGVHMARMKAAGWDLPYRRPGWRGHTNPSPPPKVLPLTKHQVNQRLTYAVRMGQLIRPDLCERCGRKGRVDGHHHDYSKPLDVEWLCRTCHMAEHGRRRVGVEVEEQKAA